MQEHGSWEQGVVSPSPQPQPQPTHPTSCDSSKDDNWNKCLSSAAKRHEREVLQLLIPRLWEVLLQTVPPQGSLQSPYRSAILSQRFSTLTFYLRRETIRLSLPGLRQDLRQERRAVSPQESPHRGEEVRLLHLQSALREVWPPPEAHQETPEEASQAGGQVSESCQDRPVWRTPGPGGQDLVNRAGEPLSLPHCLNWKQISILNNLLNIIDYYYIYRSTFYCALLA